METGPVTLYSGFTVQLYSRAISAKDRSGDQWASVGFIVLLRLRTSKSLTLASQCVTFCRNRSRSSGVTRANPNGTTFWGASLVAEFYRKRCKRLAVPEPWRAVGAVHSGAV